MTKKRTRMDELKDVIMYGPQKAKAKWEMENATVEMSRYCAWLNHLDEVHSWMIAGELNHTFFDMEELIEQCPNEKVRDLFMWILDEWKQMRAERLHLVAEDYYDRQVDMFLDRAAVMGISYYGVQTLMDILEWYMTR